jgi:signal transduction histidine kinase/streptogramin lyase
MRQPAFLRWPDWGVLPVWLLFALVANAGPAPEWSARIWQADDGLPDNRITGLVQKSNGEFWVATRGGLARFTGSKFELFQLDALSGVTGNGARAMFSDSRGRFWISAYRDVVVCLDREQASIYGRAEGFPVGQLNGMVEDRRGTVWLAIGSRVGAVQEGKFLELALPASEMTTPHVALGRDREGSVWCFANGRLGLVESGRLSPVAELEHRDVAFCGARQGGLWICGDANVYRMEAGEQPALKIRLPREVKPMTILEDREGAVWIGTIAHGLFRCFNGRVEHVETAAPQVGKLLEDIEGNIWAGTYGGGLHRLQPRAMEVLSAQAGLPTPAMISVCQDADGTYWAISASGDLVRGDGTQWSAVPVEAPWPRATASCVTAGSPGVLWIGTRGQGLFRLDLRAGTARNWTTADGLPSNSLRGLFFASDGAIWFTGNGPTSLGWLHGSELRLLAVPPSVRNIRAIVEDMAGTIWIGTSDGQVLRAAEDRLLPEPRLKRTTSSSIRAMHVTPEGSLWIAYADKGLGHFKEGRYAEITTAQGLAENAVWQVTSDRKGSLWLAGARGLYRLPLAAVLRAADNPRERLRPVLYRRAENLPHPQPHYDNSPAVCQGQNGEILFSTSMGLLALYPEGLRDDQPPPAVVLERVMVDDKIVAQSNGRFPLRVPVDFAAEDTTQPGVRLLLAPDHRRLTFEFAALSYTAPEGIRYRYRLDGADVAWSEPSVDPTAHFSRLPAGDYRFRVVASNAAGTWSEAGATIAVRVDPFYWQTWWFRLGALAAFSGLVAAVVRLVSFRRLQSRLRAVEQERALLQERTRIARDIHDDLGGSLTHIKLLSELAVQERAQQEGSSAHLRQIIETTQSVMKALDEIVWAVNPRNDTLPNLISYLGQHSVEFLRAARIACQIDLPEDPPEEPVPSDVRHHLFMVLKEALTNIVRHSGARQVWLQVQLPLGGLRINVKDDGCSFTQMPDNATADGLRNMRQRIESVGGDFRIHTELGSGTRLEIFVPRRTNGK